MLVREGERKRYFMWGKSKLEMKKSLVDFRNVGGF